MKPRHRLPQAGRVRPLLAVLLAVATVASVGVFITTRPPALPQHATVFDVPMPLPDFALTADDGSVFERSSFEGRWSMLFFGFTHCPDICPATLQKLAVARRRMADGAPALPDIVFVSVDPDRDTVEAVGAYAAAFGEGVTGVTGTLEEIHKLTDPLGIYHSRMQQESVRDYAVEHSSAVLLVNDRAELRAIFSAPHDVAALAADTALIMDAG